MENVFLFSLHYFLGTTFLITLHPNISMHILHTVLYTFPNVHTGRIFNSEDLLSSVMIFSILMT